LTVEAAPPALFQLVVVPYGDAVALLASEFGPPGEFAVPAAPGVDMLDGSDGLTCGAAANDAAVDVSFFPNRHQLLPDPDWQPVIPTAMATKTANRAWVNRIACAPCASLGRRGRHTRRDIAAGSRSLP
jgi:hypothetical protein